MPLAPQTPPAASSPRLAVLQARVFALTWLSYASYYLTRQSFPTVKTRMEDDLGLSMQTLGWIDTAYLAAYAIGQFQSGALGDRVGPRRMIGYGMIGSALCALAFAGSASPILFALFLGLNGFFQSTGWPNNVKAMQPWFGKARRGRVMGLWCTCFQVGPVAANSLAAYLAARWGWRAGFAGPALAVSAVAALVLLLLVEHPRDRGLAPPDPEPAPARPDAPAERPRILELLRMPELWCLGGAYFGLKLIRYCLLGWIAYYLTRRLHYDAAEAGHLQNAFPIGGIAGAIIIGWLTDRYFPLHRIRLAVPCVLGLAAAVLLYQRVGGDGFWPNALAMALCGFMLFGPDTLISGAAAQELGGSRATGSVAGIINGMGSVGAALSGVAVPWVRDRFGWDALFSGFMGIALLSALSLLPLALRRSPRRSVPE